MRTKITLLAMLLAAVLCGSMNAQTTAHKETLNIQVTTPGTLGDLILAQTENFSDVKYFTVSGPLNDDDLTTLCKRMTSLITLDMGDVVVSALPDNGFSYNKVITSVVLPKSLPVISNYLFHECKQLSDVTFPTDVRKIGSLAFGECEALTSVRVPETVDTLESGVFHYCKNLKAVQLPATMKYWGDAIFYNCGKLASIAIPQGLTTIPSSAFGECDAFTSIVIPSTVKTIGTSAFSGCDNLASITLPEGLTDIEANAFSYNPALTEVDLPSTLRYLGADVFNNCEMLTTIRCHAVNAPYCPAEYGLSYQPSTIDIYVPSMSLNTYKQHRGWDKHTILPLSTLPASLTFYTDMKLNVPDDLPDSYKPNMELEQNYTGASYYSYPAVTVNGTKVLSLNNFHATYETREYSWYDEDKRYCSLISNAPIRSDKVSLTYHVNYSGWSVWMFFSLPFNANVREIEFAKHSDFVIYEYLGDKRAAAEFDATWNRIFSSGTLKAGQGYIMKCSNPDEEVTFHAINDEKKNQIFCNQEITVNLQEFTSEENHNRSWNFIGNPYPCYYDSRLMEFDAPFVVWDDWSRQYATYTPYDDDYVFVPGEGFFVQRPIDRGSIVFPLEGRQGSREVVDRTPAPSRRAAAAADRTVYNLTLTAADGKADRTRFVLNPQATTAFDYGRDATKFTSLDPQVPQLYTLADGVAYSINERPLADGIVTLGMKIAAVGTYNISLSTRGQNPTTITLVDHETGQRTLLTAGAAYTFTADADILNSRFTLELGDVATAIQSVALPTQQTQPAYDLQGRRIDSHLKKGIYIIGGKKHVVK